VILAGAEAPALLVDGEEQRAVIGVVILAGAEAPALPCLTRLLLLGTGDTRVFGRPYWYQQPICASAVSCLLAGA
jgi:hypothetical protein